MQSGVTTLEHDRLIHHEEKLVGLRTDLPLTPDVIGHRQAQIAWVAMLVVLGVLGATILAPASRTFVLSGALRTLATLLAGGFGAYALVQDRHLRRLHVLSGESREVTLAIADTLLLSGVLRGDETVLQVRDALDERADQLADGLAEVVTADVVRVRVTGPSGEVPSAGVHVRTARTSIPDDPTAAREAVRRGATESLRTSDRRTVVAVPVMYHGEVVAVLEAVSAVGYEIGVGYAAHMDAFGTGAVAALIKATPAP